MTTAMHYFNTSGPVVSEDHYQISPLERVDLADLRLLIQRKRYFVLHVPPQTDKTSALLGLQDLLNAEGDYHCVYVNVEGAQAAREDVQTAIRTVLSELAESARHSLGDERLGGLWPGVLAKAGGHSALRVALTRWSRVCEKPLVLLIDELDSMVGDSRLSVLLQLRVGHHLRPKGFPQSVILCKSVYDEHDVDKCDLGLSGSNPPICIASPIYAEVVPRELTWLAQDDLPHDPAWYVDAFGTLDLDKLLESFQEFYRENSERWVERCGSREAGPQLLLQAFLQRVVNSDGRIEREYALGGGRTDLLIVWPQGERVRKYVVAGKVRHHRWTLERTLGDGVEQTAAYMDRCGADAGHLVVFDRDEARTWPEKVFRDSRTAESEAEIAVWGM